MADCRYFDSVDICKYRRDWMESRQKTTLPSSIAVMPHVTEVEVFEATEVDIGLFQEGARYCPAASHCLLPNYCFMKCGLLFDYHV